MEESHSSLIRHIAPETQHSMRPRPEQQHRFPLTRITMPTSTSSPISRTNPQLQNMHHPALIPPSRATSDDPSIMLDILRQRRRPRSGGGTNERLRRIVASAESESMREFLKEWAKEGGSGIEHTVKEEIPLAPVQRRKRSSVAPLPEELLMVPPPALMKESMEVKNPELVLTYNKNKPLPQIPESARTKGHVIVIRPNRWSGSKRSTGSSKDSTELFDLDDEVIVYDFDDDEEFEAEIDTEECVRVVDENGDYLEAQRIHRERITDDEEEKKGSWTWTAFFVPVLKTLVYIVRPCGSHYRE